LEARIRRVIEMPLQKGKTKVMYTSSYLKKEEPSFGPEWKLVKANVEWGGSNTLRKE